MDWLRHFDLTGFRSINLGFRSDILTFVCWVLSYSGLAASQIVFALMLAAFRGTRHFVFPILVTLLVAGVGLADGVKSLVPRDRPSNLTDAVHQEAFFHSSFPSGHTTTAFGTATILFLMTRDSKYRWVGPVAFLWAAGVGFSRIYRGVHWPTDVLAGACFGIAGACLCWTVFSAIGIRAGDKSEARTNP